MNQAPTQNKPDSAAAHDEDRDRQEKHDQARDANGHRNEHHSEEHPIPDDLPNFGSLTVGLLAMAGVLLLAGLFVLGYLPRQHRIAEADRVADEANYKPIVEVAPPSRQPNAGNLELPADVRALQETSVYPRTTGYLKRLLVDIGDHVKDGQLLAEIDSPEVDSQLNQAKATQEQASANLNKAQADEDLAQTTMTRYDTLSKTPGAITQQDIDEKRSQLNQAIAALAAARSNVTAAAADVQRLTDLQSFEKVTAPFAGVITTRNFDIGALLEANTPTAGRELMRIARTDTLRAFVSVPQSAASGVKMGQPATLTVRNFPGREFAGTVTRSAGAVDPNTRTLKFQIDVANKDDVLWAGMYGTISLPLLRDHPPMLIPTSALIVQADGTKVAVIEDGKVKMKTISIGRDLGQQLEVVQGLNDTEQVVSNPGERLADGVEVQIAKPQQPAGDQPKTKVAEAGK